MNRLSLDLAIQLTGNGLVRCRAGVTNHNVADYRLDGDREVDRFVDVLRGG